MRVINHKQFENEKAAHKVKKRSSLLIFSVILLLATAGFGAYWFLNNKDNIHNNPESSNEVSQNNEVNPITLENKQDKPFKTFTGEEFKNLYYQVAYPNTQQIDIPIEITGNDEADARIRSFAEERGYKPTSLPQAAIVKIDEPRLNGDDLSQPLAAVGWKSLKESAKSENIPLSIISAYRSPEWQRELFNSRLLINGITPAQVAAGIADNAIMATLVAAAVPGYSRHHTGYTIDLWCEDGSGAFVNSKCFSWIKADNYLKAKQSGWIPSYPEGADLQGPEPEPWEYVWVGTDNLK